MSIVDDYPGVTEFGAEPTQIPADTMRKIELEARDSIEIGTKLRAGLIDHPKLGSTLILVKENGTGFAFADRAPFID